jgi:predicted Fe-S protein YdhL (DUF1289 family)
MISPCVDICVIDAGGLCAGCGRTLDEIAGWSTMSDADRERLMTVAPARLAKAELEPLPA